jgi:hypothetical protein
MQDGAFNEIKTLFICEKKYNENEQGMFSLEHTSDVDAQPI